VCPPKYYADSGVCLPCDQNCKACIGKSNFCINGCEKPYLFKDNKCIADCGDSYASYKGNCEPCDIGCASCKFVDNKKICLSCDSDKYMSDNICVSECPYGQYGNQETGLCEYCSSECKECFGKTFHECYSCNTKEGYMMLKENTCLLPTCTVGFYYNKTQSECQNCPAECTECSNFTNCATCKQGYLYDYKTEKCYDPCNKIGFTHKEGNNLEQCTEICGDARNMGVLECDDGNLVDGDGCSKDCKIEEFYECSGGDHENADICINRKPLEIKSFKYFGNRTAILIFAVPAKLVKDHAKAKSFKSEIRFKEMIQFSVEIEKVYKVIDWSYSDFNIAYFKKITFQLNMNFSLSGDEVFFTYS